MYPVALIVAVLAQIPLPISDDPYYEPVNIRPDLGLKVSPKNDSVKPFKFVVRGILHTNGVEKSAACNGTVRVRFRKSNPTVAKGSTRIQPDCTYRLPLRLDLTGLGEKGRSGGTVRITARFGGNDVLQPDAASQRKATYGRGSAQ